MKDVLYAAGLAYLKTSPLYFEKNDEVTKDYGSKVYSTTENASGTGYLSMKGLLK